MEDDSDSDPVPHQIRRDFPLLDPIDFDVVLRSRSNLLTQDDDYDTPHVPVGLLSSYPEDLIRRIAAAKVSHLLQLSSIDYALKKYVSDNNYDEAIRRRKDVDIQYLVQSEVNAIFGKIRSLAPRDGESIGTLLADVTFFRLKPTFMTLFTLAHRGLIFEACAVARLALEQIAWAVAVHGVEDEEKVQRTQAQGSISRLRNSYHNAGRIYGWLSKHAHWEYSAHIKVLGSRGGYVATIYASSAHKIVILAVTAVIADVFLSSIERLYCERLNDLRFVIKARAKRHNSEIRLRKRRPTLIALKQLRAVASLDAKLLREVNEVADLAA